MFNAGWKHLAAIIGWVFGATIMLWCFISFVQSPVAEWDNQLCILILFGTGTLGYLGLGATQICFWVEDASRWKGL